MGSAVTITPDAPQVTITPDAGPTAPRSWMDSAADFGKSYLSAMNPVTAVKGLAQTIAHPVDAYHADAENRETLRQFAEQSFDKASKETDPVKKASLYANGATYMLQGVLPVIGPALQGPTSKIEKGQVASGLGEAAGMGTLLSAPSALKNTGISIPGEDLAQRLYKSALKPSTVAVPAKVAGAIGTGLEQGIPVSAGGLEKIGDLMDDLNTRIAAKIASAPNTPISKMAVASRLTDTADTFRTQVNPAADLAAVRASGTEFLQSQPSQIPASEAQAIKQGTYQQLSSKAYGELGTATVEAQKALARGLKEELANAFPELKDLNAADSKLINLDGFLEKAVTRIGNHQMFGIGTPLAAAGAKAVTGSNAAAGVVGTLKAIVDDPFVKSKLAIAIHRASKTGISIPEAATKVAAYSDALGNVANAQVPAYQASQ